MSARHSYVVKKDNLTVSACSYGADGKLHGITLTIDAGLQKEFVSLVEAKEVADLLNGKVFRYTAEHIFKESYDEVKI